MPPLSLSLLPKTLSLSKSTPITRNHLLSLYKEQLRVANSYSSYNFKHYFIRRARYKFKVELPSILSATTNSTTSTTNSSLPSPSTTQTSSSKTESSEEPSIYAPISSSSSSSSSMTKSTSSTNEILPTLTPQEIRLREWYEESLSELAILARGSLVNRLYEAPKLVVEGRGRVMVVGGGGAGMEAS